MKKLITEKIMEGFVMSHGQGAEFPIEENTLVTPSAKDVAKSNKIKFVDKEAYCAKKVESQPEPEACCEESKAPCCENKAAECTGSYNEQAIVEAIIKVLKELGVLDKILDK
jgi:ethanolamine utilization cobalamin adenosyltransferase